MKGKDEMMTLLEKTRSKKALSCFGITSKGGEPDKRGENTSEQKEKRRSILQTGAAKYPSPDTCRERSKRGMKRRRATASLKRAGEGYEGNICVT